MISEALRTKLLSDATIATAVGTKIYPVKLPDNPPMPAIVISKASGLSRQWLGGRSALADSLFQIDVFADTFPTIETLTERIRLTLLGFAGTVSGVKIQAIEQWGDIQTFESDRELFRSIITVQVKYTEG